MPNTLAQLVFLSWPLVAWILFLRLPLTQAIAATVLLGYLFIPERVGWDLPMLPPFDKSLMPSLCALIGALAVIGKEKVIALRAARRAAILAEQAGEAPAPRERPRAVPATRVSRLVQLLLGLLLVAPVLTWATNQTPLVYGWRYIPGVALYDIGSMLLSQLFIFLPLLIARRYMNSPGAQIDLLKVFVWCGFAYSFLVLYEARMSPKLNLQLYGFFAHSFIQHIRGGAYRPIVFLGHGLLVGIFLAMSVLSAATLARNNVDGRRMIWLGLTAWLLACLVLSRNMGATAIVVVALPLILFTPARLQFLVGMVLAILVLAYPLARGTGVIPTDRIVTSFAQLSVDRASSLDFRIRNEDILLEKANQKPLAGWGPWGRSRVFDQTGADIATPDGAWVIIIGVYGWIGYLGQFGVLSLPIILAGLRHRRYGLGLVDAGLLLVLCANMMDLIPNASMNPVLWFLAGTAWGRLEKSSAAPAQRRSIRRDIRATVAAARARRRIVRKHKGPATGSVTGPAAAQPGSRNLTPSKT